MTDMPRVLLTRAAEQAEPLAVALRRAGLQPVCVPTIALQPLYSSTIDQALQQLAHYDWVVLTSPNAVDFFYQRVTALGISLPALPLRFAVVGESTAAHLAHYGGQASCQPSQATSEALAAALIQQVKPAHENQNPLGGQRILYPHSAIARPTLLATLHAAGALVTALPLYQPVLPASTPATWAALQARAELLTFTSPSTAQNLAVLLNQAGLGEKYHNIPAVCIGPTTATAVQTFGWQVVAQASPSNNAGLLQAICEFFKR